MNTNRNPWEPYLNEVATGRYLISRRLPNGYTQHWTKDGWGRLRRTHHTGASQLYIKRIEMTEQELRDAIANYLLTLDNTEKDEYWGTPRDIAQDFLNELLAQRFPNKVRLRILELNKELESLEEQTAKLSEELIELNKELKE